MRGSLHPTQKPVALFEYLVKTYTNEGDVVLDNCMGSGTTAIACLNTNRKYIGFELEKVPEFLKDFEPLNYRVPKVYDETTYKIYKYVKIKDIEILITPKDRLDELSERYKLASPLFTYMKPETNEDIEVHCFIGKGGF